MEVIIFVGLQAAGKSSFYREKFIDTHIRINLDMLKTRHREKILFNACLVAKQPLVVDNTNPTRDERKKYIITAREKGFKIIGYYFNPELEECKQRNNNRSNSVPLIGLLGTYKKLQMPTYQEGFDELYYVHLERNNSFTVKTWDAV